MYWQAGSPAWSTERKATPESRASTPGSAGVRVTDLNVTSRLLGGGPLVRDGVVDPRGADWYVPRPTTPDEWRARARTLRENFEGSSWLQKLAPALEARDHAAQRLASAAERGVLVTTGQQPGLFGGPLYTWWKALTALELADRLQDSLGIPVAPVFWAATDDSDVAEASDTFIAVAGGVDRIELRPARDSGAGLSRVMLGDASLAIEAVSRNGGSAVYPRAFELVRQAYAPESTVGDAYVKLLRSVLGPLGVSVLDAAHPAVRRAAEPIVRSALLNCEEIEAALEHRSAAMRDAGFTPQVQLVRGRTLVFRNTPFSRDRVSINAAREVAREAEAEELSPNVLLRPIVECGILPTIAYVAGPAELAYFAQTQAVAATLGAERPLAVPRWSGTVLEPHILRLLDRYGLTLEDLRDPHAAEGRLARARVPEDALAALKSARDGSRKALKAMEIALRDAGGARLLQPPVIEGALRDLERRLDRLERRLIAATKSREAEMMRDIGTMRGALWPKGVPQERALNLFPLLARHGPRLLDLARERAAEHVTGIVSRSRERAIAGATGQR